MTEIHGKVSSHQSIGGKIKSISVVNANISPEVGSNINRDYNRLKNKPSIEGVELQGNKTLTDFGIPYIYYGTREYWDSQPSLISVNKAVYVYWDFDKDDEGNDVPGIKIGDGKGYLIDAPFTTDPYYNHIRDTLIHVTPEEKEFWNNKVRCFIDPTDSEKVVFTTN